MPFEAKDVMQQASTILQDNGAIRWTPPELLSYVNEGVREIVAVKPNATSATVTITLVAGAKQSLAANHTVLSRVTRNISNNKPIRVLDRRETLDNVVPGWMDNSVLAFSNTINYLVHDLVDPRTYYVAPGAIAGTEIEAVVGVMPAPVAGPAAPQILEIAAYTNPVVVPDIYRNALVDYVLYRAFTKDSGIPGAAQRAVAHKSLFDGAMGVIASGETAMALGTYAGQGSSKPSGA